MNVAVIYQQKANMTRLADANDKRSFSVLAVSIKGKRQRMHDESWDGSCC